MSESWRIPKFRDQAKKEDKIKMYLERVVRDGKETRRLQYCLNKMRKNIWGTECQLCQMLLKN